jgi:hypothetical protein
MDQNKKLPITLKEAVDLGEYDPNYLAKFPEWNDLTNHIQLEYIRRAIENRRRQLVVQWAQINNVLDFHAKPELKEVLDKISDQIRQLDRDQEKIWIEWADKT